MKLLTLLKGKALAVWLDLTEEQQGDYSVTVGELKKKLASSGFSSLEVFHTRKLQPGEALSLFVQDLKQKLQPLFAHSCYLMKQQTVRSLSCFMDHIVQKNKYMYT